MKRRIYIGDVQGCCDELRRLLDACDFDPANDRLHPAGDVVNRGPDSLGALRLLHELGAEGVLGNHDLHLLRRAAGVLEPGGGDTLDDVLAAEDRDELIAWLGAWPFVRAWDDVLLVHAGLSPRWTDPVQELRDLDPIPRDERSDFVTRVRYCDPSGERPASDWPPPDPPFAEWWRHWPASEDDERVVVFGHWARQGLLLRPRLRGLDTGCVWGKELTAWIAEEDRLVQVPAARAYAAF